MPHFCEGHAERKGFLALQKAAATSISIAELVIILRIFATTRMGVLLVDFGPGPVGASVI